MARVETAIEYNGRSFRVRCEPEKVLEALRLYESGKTAKEAGGVSGIAEWTVARLARKVGIARSPRQALLKRYNDPNSPEGRKRRVLARRVWELRGKGLTQHQIAAELGVSQPTVKTYLNMRHDPYTFDERMERILPKWRVDGMEDNWRVAVQAAAYVVGVTEEAILSYSRTPKAIDARRLAAWGMCEVLGMSMTAAGSKLGRNVNAIANLLTESISTATYRRVERVIKSRITAILNQREAARLSGKNGYTIPGKHLVRVWDVILAASQTFGVPPEDMAGRMREAMVMNARRAVVHKCYSEGMTGMELGTALKRDHTTIYNANRKAEALLDTDPDFRARYERMLELLESSGDGSAHEPTIRGGGR